METKTLSKSALQIIEQYSHFQIGNAVTNIPYFNNKTKKKRMALGVYIGKGSPSDIREEIETIIVKEKIDRSSFNNQLLKKTLTDNNIGIECSGFVYYILEAESESRNLGTISKNISFINCHGFVGQIRCAIRPVENCDVETFASDKNSKVIELRYAKPGDMITMLHDKTNAERNHILIIKEIAFENNLPKKLTYVHSVAYPEDGLYGTGVREGEIEITDINQPISSQIWTEQGRQGDSNKLFVRANVSQTEIRRLNFF